MRSKGLSFIWIDQECIIQDDPEDKALAIQAMDEVYDQAEECVAVLEVCFEEQRHLDAIEILIENNSNRLCNEDGTRDVCEALRLILSDRWFERAWCLQESTAGGTQMALLIRSDPRLTIPDCFRSEVYGCFEIQLSWLHTVIGCLEWFDAPDAEPLGADTAELARTVAGMWYDCMPQESDEERGAVSFGGRTICDAAEALYYLDRRHNSVIADRLDILANMCGYEVRLDVLALDAQGFDFSICAVVLAILNGDFSINHGCADLAATGVGGRKFVSWHQPLGHTTAPDAHELPFTWWSLLASSLQSIPLYNWYYKDPPGRNFRYSVRAGISLKRGLEIEGCLFVADKTIDVSDMVTGLLERWKERLTVSLPKRGILAIADAASRDSEFGEARHIFFIRLFCRLVEQGYDRLAQLLWKLGRSPATYRERSDPQFVRWYEADAADVLDVPGRQVKWPKPESSPTVNRSGTRSHTSPFATSWTMTMVLCQALIHGKLVVARPGSSRRQASSYSALFQDQYVDANYLAAKTNGKPISLHSHLGWYPSEWRVQVHSGTHAQIEQVSPIVASCLASVCGLWEADDDRATTTSDISATKTLFEAYTKWLDLDLTFQGFADELASLPGKYAPPNGALLLARLASFDEAIGCVAIRPLSDGGVCEMKRLYVTLAGRGTGVGKALAVAAIDQARQIGYKAVRLDTLPSMSAARALYGSLGFTEIGPYYESPLEGTIFLELIL
ncbi:hypothetical protein B0A48_16744 [Cryoendolithus antarcticus]|uniref:N-acetyltransferase domain-containing protein n=1 Tax=Cryoendolithus antarcticus TaxID=1507870 RepID=A0A1V8SDP0_9PEZI|nr:hypothetical protein B0A48_16744 [Cryoendolithus antarcticus]